MTTPRKHLLTLTPAEVLAALAGPVTLWRAIRMQPPSDYDTHEIVGKWCHFYQPLGEPNELGNRTGGMWTVACPFGVPGGLLICRETWAPADIMYQGHAINPPGVVAYRADKSAIQFDARKPRRIPAWDLRSWNWDALTWRSSTAMPAWAARIVRPLLTVGVERRGDVWGWALGLAGPTATEGSEGR